MPFLKILQELLRRAEADGAPFSFVDGAVIVGTPFQARCDRLLLVTAPYETSAQRICARDGIAPEMARRRLDAQTPLERLRAAATEELVNDGSPAQLEDKIKAFLHSLRKEEYD